VNDSERAFHWRSSAAEFIGEKKALSDSQIEEQRRRVEARELRELKAALAREFGISRANLYEYLRAPG